MHGKICRLVQKSCRVMHLRKRKKERKREREREKDQQKGGVKP